MKPLSAGTTVGRYTIESVLGNGELSITYRATCNGKAMVLKSRGDKNVIAEVRRRLKFSGVVPGTVEVSDVFETDGITYFAMDFIEGTSLRDYVHERGRLDEEQTRAIIIPVIQTMARLHSQGIIHLDIKPSNIIIPADDSEFRRPMLIDFGQQTECDRVYSPGYGAPEQAAGKKKMTCEADVYALGATMLFCITGSRPPETPGDDYLSKALADIQPATASVIRKAVSADKARRQADASALLDDLDDDATQIVPHNTYKSRNIGRVWIAVIAAILLGLLCWLIVSVASRPDYSNYIPIEEAQAESME